MGGTINEQYPVGVTKTMVLEQQIRDLKAELARLTQANSDLRKERERAVAEAQRQDGVAKGLRQELRQLFEQQYPMKLLGAAEELERLAGVNQYRMLDCNDLTERAAQLRQEAGECQK